ncbi:glycine betaine ABC transporter substrate-binding protein [Undibacterium curvum]|jgi:glycine betaine/proline transport system substrate-binding protein|uniref:glycine betaine ABC transporter substrate-binding protein n=1 Tax=Undibacterium curvum TaxID=2762294 RepID=UPI003D09B7A1
MKDDRRKFVVASGIGMLGILGATNAVSQSSYQAKKIRLGVTDLSFHRITGAVVAAVLERMGFDVQRSYALHEQNFERLRNNDIDMIASAWLPYSHGVYKKRVEEVIATKELGLHYEPYAMWGVPDYVPEALVSSVPDLKKPEVTEKMNRVIQGIGPGAGITRFSIKMMEQYGLTNAGYEFRTGTEADCVRAFEDAVKEKKWVVVPLWWPQFLHYRYKIRELSDPKSLLGGVDRAVLLAREDRLRTLFNDSQIAKLNKIKLSNKTVSELDYLVVRDRVDLDLVARQWLDMNHDLTKDWV